MQSSGAVYLKSRGDPPVANSPYGARGHKTTFEEDKQTNKIKSETGGGGGGTYRSVYM